MTKNQIKNNMQSIIKGCVFLSYFSYFLLLLNCATTGKKGVTQEEFNQLVWESRIMMESAIFSDVKNIVGNNPISVYAIVNSELNNQYSQYYERHITEFSGMIVATRRTDALDREFNFQFSGRVSDDEIRSIVRMLGVNFILIIDVNMVRPTSRTSSSITSNDTWQYTLYEIERGLVLFSFTDSIAIHRESILRDHYIISTNSEVTNNFDELPVRTNPFYYDTPIAEMQIDFGFGPMLYLGFRPSREEFSLVLNGQYFKDVISPTEDLVPQSFYSIENNTILDERIKMFMRINNLTLAATLYRNEINGFTYIVNYIFDNFRTFGLISMDSTGYER